MLEGDHEALDTAHPEHYLLSWLYCVDDCCSEARHLGSKIYYDYFPIRYGNDAILRVMNRDLEKYYLIKSTYDNIRNIISLTLRSPEAC